MNAYVRLNYVAAIAIATTLCVAACSGVQTASSGASGLIPAKTGAAPAKHSKSAGSVTYQANTEHSGYVDAKLRPPLKQLWAVNLGGSVGYPVIADGVVVVAADGDLVALDPQSGKTIWTQPAPSGGGWVGPAYDNGTIFSTVLYTNGSSGTGMYAFDATSGEQIWSAETPGQYAFSSPPAAASGAVYTAGAGTGGTVYAYAESNGDLQWTGSVENGDDSSPVVTKSGVFVSYACPQTYDFNPKSGSQIWHYNGPCEGGGGSTPALYDKLLFVEDSDAISGFNGLILSASSGSAVGEFNAIFTPAFAHHSGFFVESQTTLVARKVPSMSTQWTATLSGDSYATPPLVVGSIVYVETASGDLLGYEEKTGKETVETNLGYGDSSPGFFAGLGYGSSELIVPAGAELIALGGK